VIQWQAVEFHDARPKDWFACISAADLCDQLYGRFPEWAVIPRPSVKEWLTAQAFGQWLSNKGDVFWLHGLRHRHHPGLKRSFWGRFLQRICHGEAEWAGLSPKQSKHLLRIAVYFAQDYGLHWRGFIAPTWHGPLHLAKDLAELNFGVLSTRFNNRIPGQKWSIPISLPTNVTDELWTKSLHYSIQLATKFSWLPWRLVLHPQDFASDVRRDLLKQLLKDTQWKPNESKY
jgi:predicted deacetylase